MWKCIWHLLSFMVSFFLGVKLWQSDISTSIYMFVFLSCAPQINIYLSMCILTWLGTSEWHIIVISHLSMQCNILAPCIHTWSTCFCGQGISHMKENIFIWKKIFLKPTHDVYVSPSPFCVYVDIVDNIIFIYGK